MNYECACVKHAYQSRHTLYLHKLWLFHRTPWTLVASTDRTKLHRVVISRVSEFLLHECISTKAAEVMRRYFTTVPSSTLFGTFSESWSLDILFLKSDLFKLLSSHWTTLSTFGLTTYSWRNKRFHKLIFMQHQRCLIMAFIWSANVQRKAVHSTEWDTDSVVSFVVIVKLALKLVLASKLEGARAGYQFLVTSTRRTTTWDSTSNSPHTERAS